MLKLLKNETLFTKMSKIKKLVSVLPIFKLVIEIIKINIQLAKILFIYYLVYFKKKLEL